MRPTVMEVSLKAFNNNIDSIQKYVGNKELMPVIKANAYGTYINKRINILNRFNIVAVATVDEAIELRQNHYAKEIFVLNQPYIDDLSNIIKYNITIGLSDECFLEKAIELKSKIKVHLEIETGMNRTGISLDNLEKFIEKIKTSNIIVEGVYTHLSSADYDQEYTKHQLDIFKRAVNIITDNFEGIKYIHSSASNGLINYNDEVSNLVRPGIILYGFKSFDEIEDKINIDPVCRLKTKVIFCKDVNNGESISYSRTYITTKKTRIATIPIGYADGLRRSLSNKGTVVINGKIAPIIGNVCMDSCMIDVTHIENVEVGTDVYIWDNNIQTLDDIANECGTINYEIMCTISNRVKRIYIEKEKL